MLCCSHHETWQDSCKLSQGIQIQSRVQTFIPRVIVIFRCALSAFLAHLVLNLMKMRSFYQKTSTHTVSLAVSQPSEWKKAFSYIVRKVRKNAYVFVIFLFKISLKFFNFSPNTNTPAPICFWVEWNSLESIEFFPNTRITQK